MTREEIIYNAASQFATHFIDTGETDFYGHFVKELGLDDAEQRGFIHGAKWADENPKSPWISVDDDLPYNNSDVIHFGFTNRVLVIDEHKNIFIAYMKKNGNNEWIWYSDEDNFGLLHVVTHWMHIPKLKEE